jgi:hypothetical protein
VGLPESPAHAEKAAITRTADAVDVASRTMPAEIDLQNDAGRWQPGSYAQVRLTTAAAETNWTIPASTLQMRVDGPHVAVVDRANRVEIRTIKLGRDLGQRIAVTAGITGDERLIVNPGSDITNGANVKIRENEEHLAHR